MELHLNEQIERDLFDKIVVRMTQII